MPNSADFGASFSARYFFPGCKAASELRCRRVGKGTRGKCEVLVGVGALVLFGCGMVLEVI